MCTKSCHGPPVLLCVFTVSLSPLFSLLLCLCADCSVCVELQPLLDAPVDHLAISGLLFKLRPDIQSSPECWLTMVVSVGPLFKSLFLVTWRKFLMCLFLCLGRPSGVLRECLFLGRVKRFCMGDSENQLGITEPSFHMILYKLDFWTEHFTKTFFFYLNLALLHLLRPL